MSLDGVRKELDGRYSARKAQMSDEDAELIGRLFISCAKAAGGAHEDDDLHVRDAHAG